MGTERKELSKEEITAAIARDYLDRVRVYHEVTADLRGMGHEEDPLHEDRFRRYEKACRESLYQIGFEYGISPEQIDQAIEFFKTQS